MVMIHHPAPQLSRRRCVAPGCCVGTVRCRRPCIPTEVRRRGRVLLNQQLWLFGQDIRRPEGNALIDYGFVRTPPPEGVKAGNTYSIGESDGTDIFLWGFGLFFHHPARGGIFIPRFTFTPRLARFAGLPDRGWAWPQLQECRVPHGANQWATTRHLFIPALRWIARYERWIVRRRGLDYRAACLAAWPHAARHAAELDNAWEQLIADCDAGMSAFVATRLRGASA